VSVMLQWRQMQQERAAEREPEPEKEYVF